MKSMVGVLENVSGTSSSDEVAWFWAIERRFMIVIDWCLDQINAGMLHMCPCHVHT